MEAQMKESLTEWWGSFAACTREIVGIFFGSGDCPARPQRLAARENCTEQLTGLTRKRSRHRAVRRWCEQLDKWAHSLLMRNHLPLVVMAPSCS
jgi:hypothetical protein